METQFYYEGGTLNGNERPMVCEHLLPNGDCGHPDLKSRYHACVLIKFKKQCLENRYPDEQKEEV